MSTQKSFSPKAYAKQAKLAEQELAAFVGAVTALFGPEQARLSAEDWLDEAREADKAAASNSCDWRAVTIAASACLANRISDGHHLANSEPEQSATQNAQQRPPNRMRLGQDGGRSPVT